MSWDPVYVGAGVSFLGMGLIILFWLLRNAFDRRNKT